MAAVKAPFGFKPLRSLSGNFNPSTRRFAINAPNATYVGDPVVLSTGNTVKHLHYITGATAGSGVEIPVGIVAGLLDSNQKPLTFSQPTRGPVILASTAGYVDVYVDPHNTYWVATNTTAGASNVFAAVGVSAFGSAHANVATGRSPIGVEVGTDTSAVGYRPFRILGAAPSQKDEQTLPTDNWTDGVEVILAVNFANALPALA